jgi:hypothetical protein
MKQKIIIIIIVCAIGAVGTLVFTNQNKCTVETIETNCNIAEVRGLKSQLNEEKNELQKNVENIEKIEL